MEFLIELLRKQDPEQQAREHLDREQQEDTIMFALNMIHTGVGGLGEMGSITGSSSRRLYACAQADAGRLRFLPVPWVTAHPSHLYSVQRW